MKKFEYKMVHRDNEKLQKAVGILSGSIYSAKWSDTPADIPFANRLGDEGWELVHIQSQGTSSYFFFKREKQ